MYQQSRDDDLARIADLEARLGTVEEQLYRTIIRAQSAEQQLANLTWQRDNWQRLYHNHLWHSSAAHAQDVDGKAEAVRRFAAQEATVTCELMPSACSRSHLVDDGEHIAFLEWKERQSVTLVKEDF